MHISKAWVPGLFAVLALVLAACGGSDPTATPLPPPTATAVAPSSSTSASADLSVKEEEYLSLVKSAESLSFEIFAGFRQTFSQSYPTREALLAALLEAGVGTPFLPVLAALEDLDPPERFREDHRIWLEATRELARLDAEAAEAVRDNDAVKFALYNGQLGEISSRARLALSPVFCQGTAANPLAASGCVPTGSGFEREYDNQLNELLRGFLPRFASLSGTLGFPLSLTPEELGQVMSSLSSEAVDLFQGISSAVETLTPPEDLLTDHERHQAYFGESLSIINQVDQLREAGDSNAARGEFLKMQIVFCDARQSFESADFKEAVAVVFSGFPGVCGGTPF